jgi:hypothetical protein
MPLALLLKRNQIFKERETIHIRSNLLDMAFYDYKLIYVI